MRAELPWNVAGIPPEAREAARAAARREGLSVGEWLTRRILRSFSGMEEDVPAMPYDNRAPLDSWGMPPSSASRRDTEEMMARVGRSENESNEAWRRIEDQLRGLGRRLDSSERSHGESNRVISRTAQEINISAREQAQAFDQLGLNVMSLNERLERLERSSAHDGIKDAVKALHQGLSRLADQITATANNSAGQIVQITGNLEQLANRVGQARVDSENADKALDQRISASENVIGHRIEAGEKAIEARLSAAEKTAQFNTNALDHALEKIEANANQRATDQVENQRRSAAHEESLNRLEDSIARLEMRLPDAEFERRLDGIERSVTGMADRLTHFNPTEKIDATMQALSHRLESLEKDHSDLVSEMRNKLRPIEPPAYEAPSYKNQGAPAASAYQPHSAFEAPPVAEPPPPSAYEPPPAAQAYEPPPAIDAFATPTGFSFDIPPEAGAESFAPDFEDVFADTGPDAGTGAEAEPENFLAQARRSARAASEKAETERRTGLSGFRWGKEAAAEGAEKAKPRYVIPAIVALIVVLAAAAALVLSQRAKAPVQTSAKPNGPTFTVPAPPGSNDTQFVVAPQAAPGDTGGNADDFTSERSEPAESDNPPRTAMPLQQRDVRSAPVNRVPDGAKAAPSADRVIQLANAGNPVALTIIGLRALDGTNGSAVNLPDGVKFLTQAAEKGQAVAQYRLGTLYERGQGIPADAAKAAHWYEMAANQGNRKAMHNLAVSYAGGATGKKNMAEAARWFAKAAALGLSDSQFNLAVLYERGDGVPQSLLDAYKWYSIAAAAGDTESKARIGVLQTQLSDTDKAAANKSAATFHAAPLNRSANVPPEPADIG
jgi:localization factor PodJL